MLARLALLNEAYRDVEVISCQPFGSMRSLLQRVIWHGRLVGPGVVEYCTVVSLTMCILCLCRAWAPPMRDVPAGRADGWSVSN